MSGDGNSYTTEFRQLDPRLGRWFSVDPVFQPWQSPYTSMNNNPICLNDPLGLDPEITSEGSGTPTENTIDLPSGGSPSYTWNPTSEPTVLAPSATATAVVMSDPKEQCYYEKQAGTNKGGKNFWGYLSFYTKQVHSTLPGAILDGTGIAIDDREQDGWIGVGHEAQFYVDGSTGKAYYSQFGRYDNRGVKRRKGTSLYNILVEGQVDFIEEIDLLAEFDEEGEITNVMEILQAIRDDISFNEHAKGHSPYGNLRAAVLQVTNEAVEKLKTYEKAMADNGSIPYGSPWHTYCSKYARNCGRAMGLEIPKIWGGKGVGLIWYGTATIRYLVKKYGANVYEVGPSNQKLEDEITEIWARTTKERMNLVGLFRLAQALYKYVNNDQRYSQSR